MTEAEFSYHEDVAKRSKEKNSVFHKKNGPAVPKLGKKNMSWQEIRSKHGPVKTYSLDSFMSFAMFKAMEHDLQVEYVNKLQDKYDISVRHISEILFEAGSEGLRSYLKIYDLYKMCNPNKKRAKTNLEEFKNEVAEFKRREKLIEAIDACTEEAGLPEFMAYEDYVNLSLENKITFINNLVSKYRIGTTAISEKLFGLNHSTISNYFRAHKVLDKVLKGPTGIESIKYRKVFEKAVDEWKNKESKVEEAENTMEQSNVAVLKDVVNDMYGVEPNFMEKATDKLNEIAENRGFIDSNDIEKELGIHTANNTVILPTNTESIVTEYSDGSMRVDISPVPNAQRRRETVFYSSYVSTGLDEEELGALMTLFRNKKVQVSIDIKLVL